MLEIRAKWQIIEQITTNHDGIMTAVISYNTLDYKWTSPLYRKFIDRMRNNLSVDLTDVQPWGEVDVHITHLLDGKPNYSSSVNWLAKPRTGQCVVYSTNGILHEQISGCLWVQIQFLRYFSSSISLLETMSSKEKKQTNKKLRAKQGKGDNKKWASE